MDGKEPRSEDNSMSGKGCGRRGRGRRGRGGGGRGLGGVLGDEVDELFGHVAVKELHFNA